MSGGGFGRVRWGQVFVAGFVFIGGLLCLVLPVAVKGLAVLTDPDVTPVIGLGAGFMLLGLCFSVASPSTKR